MPVVSICTVLVGVVKSRFCATGPEVELMAVILPLPFFKALLTGVEGPAAEVYGISFAVDLVF